jgi:hypothetical protein
LGRRFGVSASTIFAVVSGHTWSRPSRREGRRDRAA